MPSQCTEHNKSGAPCSAQAWRDNLCRWHHPDLEAQRAEERRKGGTARSNAARARKALAGTIRDMTDVKARLMVALAKVEAGELESGPANAMANLARAIATIVQVGELEDRIRELESRAGVRKPA
jgi:hypothetical protein